MQTGQPRVDWVSWPMTWQRMDPRLLRTSLLHKGEVHEQQGTNSHEGTGISHYSKITPLPVPSDMWDGLHTCLHLMVGLYNVFGKSTV